MTAVSVTSNQTVDKVGLGISFKHKHLYTGFGTDGPDV